MPIRKILVATDFSPCARAALDLAVEVARPAAASIQLLHAYELPVYASPDGSILTLDSLEIERIERSVDERLRAEQDRVAKGGVPLSTARADGHAGEVILRFAEQEHSDLIVMGTHGRTGLGRLFLGSVAERVLRAAPCPVLVVRDKARD